MPQPQAWLIPVRDVDERLRGQWRALAAAAAEPNPFHEPSVVEAAVRHLEGGERVHLLVVETGGTWQLAVPVRALRSYRRVPVPALSVWRHDYALLGVPLLRAGAGAEPFGLALEVLRAAGQPWLAWDLMWRDGPVAAALDQALAYAGTPATVFEPWQRPVAAKRAGITRVEGRMSHRRLRTLGRVRRRLSEALSGAVETVDLAPTALESGIEDFLAIEASGWKGRDGGAFACHAGHPDFLRTAVAALAADGRVELWALGVPGRRPVALQLNLLAGDTVFHFKIAYDEEFRRFSPGVLLELDVLERFHADRRLCRLDSCTAAPTLSGQLCPDRRTVATLLVPLTGVRGRVAARLTPAAAQLFRWGRARLDPTTRAAA